MDFYIPFDSYLREYRYKYLALYHAMRTAIVSGTVPYGTKLPSSREMAKLYEVSRGSVNQVYEMLLSEGFVAAEVGRGTFVSYRSPASSSAVVEQAEISMSDWGKRVAVMPSYHGSRAAAGMHDRTGKGKVDLQAWHISTDHFPADEWNRALYAEVRRTLRQSGTDSLHPFGHLPLRQAISHHLRRMRGIAAPAEHICIYNGSMQAIALLAQLLVNEGDPVVIENPCYPGTARAVRMFGGNIVKGRVDGNGIVPDDWNANLLFVTPSRHFPTGAVLPLERRRQLLTWAAGRKAIIVEDDYDSEFRYGGRPIEPLKTLDSQGCVVYVGTFSKTMYPDLRIGYAVLPPGLVEPMNRAKHLYEPYPSSLLEQRALAAFMKSGHYERHLRRMKRIYGRKYAVLYKALQEMAADLFDIVPCDAGLHIYGVWRHSAEAYERWGSLAEAKGVIWSDGRRYQLEGGHPAACFGFAHLVDEQLERGVRIMAEAWREYEAEASV
ncbi:MULTISPECIES: PLP-dependent aminotransferase family protein [unclassified Paenibacillus]|uniref:MocR-like pyridoxine biosynthesis transcription factor PdxR n=1 Tax=unclassified Paenibacillus TaxID=185978 RepID=UPI001C107D4E|nr:MULTISPECIES: PLP-dependent aminotransferase family protein [unclassified Paenibacillus]MBU5440854.1 PLP-dependent aminotransferase family protein [Paenibacillus sp. MSJ-34]CAH0118447.1 HTH-type transcriptional regulatory protein GabR [Paenibacillus sp. CECT 9249]